MESFNISINNSEVNSKDIHGFLIKGQRQKAIEHIIEMTGCNKKEAEEIVSDIYDLSLKNRDSKVQSWKYENPQQSTNVIDKNKEFLESRQQNIPHCPTCNSTNLKKISTTSKAINAVAFGLLGNKRKKTFHCNSCGYEW